MKAIEKGDAEKVKKILDKPWWFFPDFDYGSDRGTTPLYEAIKTKNKEVIAELARYTFAKWYTFRQTAINGDIPMMKVMLAMGCRISDHSLSGSNVLHLAIENNRLDMVKFLVEEQKMDIHAIRQTTDWTDYDLKEIEEDALDIAKRMGRKQIYNYLTNWEKKQNAPEPEKESPTKNMVIMTPQRMAETLKNDNAVLQQLIQDNQFEDAFEMLSYKQSVSVYQTIRLKVNKPTQQIMEKAIREKREHVRG